MAAEQKTKDKALALLSKAPELANDARVVADNVDCSVSTARRYINDWEATKHIRWEMDRVAPCQPCARCGHTERCHLLDALTLPVLCERVPEEELWLAELNGLRETLEAARVQ